MTPKERPIIFSAEMVRAILEGRKTQTRRPIKPQPPEGYKDPFYKRDEQRWFFRGITPVVVWPIKGLKAPGRPGDRLWIKETWRNNGRCENGIQYKADMPEEIVSGFMWKSPIYMPRWASRITLEIMDIRVERIQDITEKDFFAEGSYFYEKEPGFSAWHIGSFSSLVNENTWKNAFAQLWDSFGIKKGFGWDMNPWVWVIKFKKLEDAS